MIDLVFALFVVSRLTVAGYAWYRLYRLNVERAAALRYKGHNSD